VVLLRPRSHAGTVQNLSLGDPPPQLLVLFGASGDLTHRKILPALYNLAHDGLLPEHFAVVGYASTDGDDAAFRVQARRSVEQFSRRRVDETRWSRFADTLFYVAGTFEDPGRFAVLNQRLSRIDGERGTEGRRLYYCATPPATFPTIVGRLGECGQRHDAKIVLEKPIGHDVASARALDRVVSEVFEEHQVFRIDHYLGNEIVQNILVFRFANPMIERIWNGEAIEHVQLTVAESIGIEGRGGYYETAGAMRDMVQNHLLQVLSLLAMERPRSQTGDDVRDAKSALLRAVRPFDPAEVVRGQYSWGVVEGQESLAYRDEPDVAPESQTETFVAARAWIDNDRWRGVPFLLRTGKRLPHRATEVVVELRDPGAGDLFADMIAGVPCNKIAIELQPEPGISVDVRAKEPGAGVAIQTVPMRFSYGTSFKIEPPEAYERLLADALAGDQTLFLREDSIERAWEIVAAPLAAPGPTHLYPAGTWGPSADELIAPHRWHLR
jgi:glucose-6-phosphate 1-dehydrogenase